MKKEKNNGTTALGCRIPSSDMLAIKKVMRPGTFCSALIRDFFKIKLHEPTISEGTAVISDDGSVIYTANVGDIIILTLKNGDTAKAIELNAKSASHLIIKLNCAINSIK